MFIPVSRGIFEWAQTREQLLLLASSVVGLVHAFFWDLQTLLVSPLFVHVVPGSWHTHRGDPRSGGCGAIFNGRFLASSRVVFFGLGTTTGMSCAFNARVCS